MKSQSTIRPRLQFELTYRGRRTLRGRLGFALMRLGARLAAEPVEFKRL